MARSGWSVDPKSQVVMHESGLRVQLAGGEVIDILEIPRGLPTRELPKLLEQAVAAYATHKPAGAAVTPSAPPAQGPRRARLSLKRSKTEA